mmetsp:Transcript_32804/g.55316  ORF Transcript_32804/g.55316 Transcript_32804/m.55316 type:complete len:269 (+) Transcript_32804:103-909(+)|eukprot:CAMPEP_0175013610 /NCGR_PEP_ID=MMETSP0005-20121125/10028_1 /TAXON_ID=420556 /ORGANISM="Ochromonas sp., Strain CCMP1393" /LENGTH=268 /DNA_ID=CAMNT_0016270113 /DNA_START=24 /DNA_END=830 /DNA_ORIENTATION=-
MELLDEIFGEDSEADISESRKCIRPTNAGVFTFHTGTEEALYYYVTQKAKRGNPGEILRAIDEYCYTVHWMMHVGDLKLPVIQKALNLAESSAIGGLVIVELGSYCGYSAIFLASHMNENRGDHLYCVEIEPQCVQWTRRMLEFADLSTMVTVVEGTAAKFVTTNRNIDMLFIDHDKSAYLSDLLSIEDAGLLRSGSVVLADNVLSFGVQISDYLEHVRSNDGLYSSSMLHESTIEYYLKPQESSAIECYSESQKERNLDGMELSIFK